MARECDIKFVQLYHQIFKILFKMVDGSREELRLGHSGIIYFTC
jgi:hypothetical protein